MSQPGAPRFTASSTQIAFGDSVTLSWAVPGSDSVFISGVGTVPGEGQRSIQPERERTFVLVSPDRGGRNNVLSVLVRVEGAKGGDGSGTAPSFVVRRTFDVKGDDLFHLLGKVDATLQRDFSFSAPDWVRQPSGVWVITTELRERPDLVLQQERTVGMRRMAYRIVVNGAPGSTTAFHCEIASVIQYRTRIERQFYPEQSDTLYTQAIDRLGQRLGWSS